MSIIGFIGSGNVGQALARAVIGRGHEVIMSNSRGPSTLSALIGILGQRARAGSTADAIEQAESANRRTSSAVAIVHHPLAHPQPERPATLREVRP